MRCIVPGCIHSSSSLHSKDITYHKLPTKQIVYEAWLRALGWVGSLPPASATVCSEHFHPEDLDSRDPKQLRANAVPVIYQATPENISQQREIDMTCTCNTKDPVGIEVVEIKKEFVEPDEVSQEPLSVDVFDIKIEEHRFDMPRESMNQVLPETTNRIADNEIKVETCDSVVEDRSCNNVESIKTEFGSIENEIVYLPVPNNEDGHQTVEVKEERMTIVVTEFKQENCEEMEIDTKDTLGEDYSSDLARRSPAERARGGMYLEIMGPPQELGHTGTSKHHGSTTHPIDKLYTCGECAKSFPTKMDLRKHMKTHSNQKPFPCNMCKKSFSFKNSLQLHIKTHNGERPYSCNLCTKSFVYKQSLQIHINSHSDFKPYTCDLCKKSFTQKCTLHKHMRIHTGDKPFSCPVCFKAFAQKCYIQKHLRTHSTDKSFSCTKCDKSFTFSDSLRKHLKEHSGETPYSCDVCAKSFVFMSLLRKHAITHSYERPHACDVCDKTFTRKENLKTHMKVQHSNETRNRLKANHNIDTEKQFSETFSCKSCSKTFPKRYILKKHMKIHSDVKYSCEVCTKSFVLLDSYKRHVIIHTGSKPFSCELCARSFRQKGALKSHILTQHMKHKIETIFSCEICDKSYNYKSVYKRHLKTHSKLKSDDKLVITT